MKASKRVVIFFSLLLLAGPAPAADDLKPLRDKKVDAVSISIPAELGTVNERHQGNSDIAIILVKRDKESAGGTGGCEKIVRKIFAQPLGEERLLVAFTGPYMNDYMAVSDINVSILDLNRGAAARFGQGQRQDLAKRFEKFSILSKRMRELVSAIARERLPKEIARLIAKSEDFRSGLISANEYARFLVRISKKLGVSVDKFKNVRIFLRAANLERKIEPAKAEYQRDELLGLLRMALGREDISRINQAGLALKNGETAKVVYYNFLKKMSDKAGINIRAYGYLKKYIDFLNASADLDKKNLGDDLAGLNSALEKRLLSSASEEVGETARVVKDFYLLTHIVSLGPTRGEYDLFIRDKDRFHAVEFRNFFNRQADKLLLDPLLKEEDVFAITMFDHSERQMDKFFSVLYDAETLLRSSSEKEDAMVKDIIEGMKKEAIGVGIVIIDDNHFDMVTRELRLKEISYVIITPSIPEPKRDGEFPPTMILKGR